MMRRQKLVVPDVVGLQWENALAHLRNEGFVNHRVHYAEAYQPVDTVVSQVPLKGQIASSDDEIVLHVSKRSFVRFLPSVYQSTGSGANPDFVRNFLWIFHQIWDSISRHVDRMHQQFSPYTADPEFLPWLSQWVAITLDADWPTVKKRKILRSAAELYQWRGTAGAIRRLLEIFTDVTPEIAENEWPYHGLWVGVHSSIGVDTIVLPPVNLAHCFVVRFPRTYEELGEEMVGRIHQVIQAEKPAHTVYFLEFAPDRGGAGERAEDVPFLPVGFAPARQPDGGMGAAAGGPAGVAGAAAAPGTAPSGESGAAAAPAEAAGAGQGTTGEGGEDAEAPVGLMGIGIAAALIAETGEAAVAFHEPEPEPQPEAAAEPAPGEDAEAGEAEDEDDAEAEADAEDEGGPSGDGAPKSGGGKRKPGKKGKRKRR